MDEKALTRQEQEAAFVAESSGNTKVDFMKILDGVPVEIRILPRINVEEKKWGEVTPYVRKWFHYIKVGGKVITILCNKKAGVFDEKCPVCETIDRITNKVSASEKEMMEARGMRPQQKFMTYAVGSTGEIELLTLSAKWGRRLVSMLMELQNSGGYPHPVDDPEKGFWIKVHRTGTGSKTDYTFSVVRISDKQDPTVSRIHVDPISERILHQLKELPDLDEQYRYREYESNVKRLKGEDTTPESDDNVFEEPRASSSEDDVFGDFK